MAQLANLTGTVIRNYDFERLPKLATLELPALESGMYLVAIVPSKGKMVAKRVSVVRR